MKLTRLERLKILTQKRDDLQSVPHADTLNDLKIIALTRVINGLQESIIDTLQYNWAESLVDADNVIEDILLKETLK